jgi:hypothetical protein
MAVAPFEIISAPYDVYVAPVGTAFPDVSQAPAVAWLLLGTSGNKNYDDDGVVVTHQQNIETFTPVGLTAPRKAFRTTEGLEIDFRIVDVSATQYARVLNNATVTNTAAGTSIGGNLNFPLLQGMQVNVYALLMRSLESAGGSGFNSQYEVPIAFQNSEVEVAYKKGDPAGLNCEWMALWDSTLGFGRHRSQTVAAS